VSLSIADCGLKIADFVDCRLSIADLPIADCRLTIDD